MKPPTLFLTVGLPGTGKTVAARRIEVEQPSTSSHEGRVGEGSLRAGEPATGTDVIEGRLVEIGLRALELGVNVVIDYGLWGRDERSALRQAAADRGAVVEMRYFELDPGGAAADDSTSARPKRRTRRGPCRARSWPSGPPRSTSRRPASSTAANRSTAHRLGSRPGTSGAAIAGRPRSPDG